MDPESNRALETALDRFRRSVASIEPGQAVQLPAKVRIVAPGVPHGLRGATLDGFDTACTQVVRDFLGEWLPRRCLVLAGSTGSRKSWAAAAGLDARPDRSRVFVHWPTLHRAWRAFGPVGDRAREQLLHTRFIVLDDLGRERAWGQPDAPDPVYEDVFCLLSDAGKTVICTTNFSAARLFALFTDRVLSRFKGGWGQFFSAAGEPDYRLTKPWERQP